MIKVNKIRNEIPLMPVEHPCIGMFYHLSWAKKHGMVWVLIEIKGDVAVMRTPKTRKILNAKLSDLRHTRANEAKILHAKQKLNEIKI